MPVERKSPDHGRVISVAPGHSIYKALVVDDNDDNRKLLVILLESVGMAVRHADNSLGALELYRSWKPHVVFTILRLDGMNGFDLARKIREQDDEPNPVLIAVSASVFDSQPENGLSSEFDAMLKKPYVDSEIYHLLEKYLGMRFVYEKTDLTAIHDQETLKRYDLNQLSQEQLSEIEQACIQGNADRMRQIIDGFGPESSKLAKALSAMVDEYEFHEILACINERMSGE